MKPGLIDDILCPLCFSRPRLSVDEERSGTVYSGAIECPACGSSYPVDAGVALLSVIDHAWKPMIGEIVARLDIRDAVEREVGFEQDREEAADSYHEETGDLMARLFEEATRGLGIGPGCRVLDLGAGLCETSESFAGLGADVVASDVELSHLKYVNFWGDEPTHREGSTLPVISPRRSMDYFSRVMADIHRIPFADGTFDVTMCRSTIHHLDRVSRALAEMARVTRKGGSIVLVSEPVRSMIDPEIEYLEGVFDYEEGLHERSLPIVAYTLPLRRYCNRLLVQYFRPGCKHRTERLFESLGLDHRARYTDGETLGFAGSCKLLLAGTGINVTGSRSGARVRKPRVMRRRSILIGVEEMVDPDRERFAALYRSCLRPGHYPFSVEASSPDRSVLAKGWRDVESGDGHTYRYTHRNATCFLRNSVSSRCLVVTAQGYPPEAGAATGSVFVNGSRAGGFDMTAPGWHELAFAKPLTAEALLEVTIRNDSTFVPDMVLNNGDTRELGIPVERVEQA